MSNFTVTATDKKLLDLLATDAKLTHDQLAAMLGVAEAEVSERIAVLEAEGIIKGYQAVIDWEAIDANKATALIQLKVTPEPDQASINSRIASCNSKRWKVSISCPAVMI